MAGSPHRTDLHLVPDLQTALEVAHSLDAQAVELDMEGVLGNYVGNEPYAASFSDFMRGQARQNMLLARVVIQDRQDVVFGIVTNNTNQPDVDSGEGLVTRVADILDIPFVHKGMKVGGVALRSKPSGELTGHFCELVEVSPTQTVLIDDQGVKNAGEAVKSGLKAIIVPDPIGLPRSRSGRVEEHAWVRRARRLEPSVYRSLEKQGLLAKIAYRKLAGIDSTSVGAFHDHRSV